MALNGKGKPGLTREEAICLVDACRDGDISDADIARLTDLLESHDERAMWVLDELELSGMIAQALDSTDTNSFLRGFLERLAAEKSGDDFADVAEQRLAEKGDSGQQQESPGSADAMGMVFGQKSGTAIQIERVGSPGKLRLVLFGIVVAALVVAGVTLLTRSTPSVGRVVSASPGVMVSREAGEERAAAGMLLRPGDALQVPREGRAVLSYEDGTRVKLLDQTKITLAPVAAGNKLTLVTGKVSVETPGMPGEEAVAISSPHALIESTSASEYSVTATPTSTRVAVTVGEVTLRRHDSAETRIVQAGQDAVIIAGNE